MLTEHTLQPIFTDINPNNKTISIAIDTIVLRNGEQISVERNRRAFAPGDLDAVKAFTNLSNESPEILYLNAIWTPEVIEAYVQSLEQNEF